MRNWLPTRSGGRLFRSLWESNRLVSPAFSGAAVVGLDGVIRLTGAAVFLRRHVAVTRRVAFIATVLCGRHFAVTRRVAFVAAVLCGRHVAVTFITTVLGGGSRIVTPVSASLRRAAFDFAAVAV